MRCGCNRRLNFVGAGLFVTKCMLCSKCVVNG